MIDKEALGRIHELEDYVEKLEARVHNLEIENAVLLKMQAEREKDIRFPSLTGSFSK